MTQSLGERAVSGWTIVIFDKAEPRQISPYFTEVTSLITTKNTEGTKKRFYKKMIYFQRVVPLCSRSLRLPRELRGKKRFYKKMIYFQWVVPSCSRSLRLPREFRGLQ